MKRHSKHSWIVFLPVLIPFGWLLFTGFLGLDFGAHWDEMAYQVRPVKKMFESGTFLPDTYIYPSFCYWIGSAAVIPSFFQERATGVPGIKGRVFKSIESQGFLMRLRGVYLVLTSITVILVFLTALAAGNSPLEAFIAAAWLGFSWEIGYHARWVAVDGILMLFGALTLLFSFLAVESVKTKKQVWLKWAAIAVGLGMGTKYPGALLFIVVAIATWFTRQKEERFLGSLKRIVLLGLLSVLVYLITTPGTIIQPISFRYWTLWVQNAYSHSAEWSRYGMHVDPGIAHLYKMFVYLGLVLFSHFAWISALATLLVFVGIYSTWRKNTPAFWLLGAFPLVYIIYFSRQQMMNVRNLLVIVPFLALFLAQGVRFLSKNIKKKEARFALMGTLLLCFTINAFWELYAAETVHARHSEPDFKKISAYIVSRPGEKFFLSSRVRNGLKESSHFSNLVTDPKMAEELICSLRDVPHVERWPTNRFHQFITWFPPYEVNLEYYTTWAGDDHIVVLSSKELNNNQPLRDAFEKSRL